MADSTLEVNGAPRATQPERKKGRNTSDRGALNEASPCSRRDKDRGVADKFGKLAGKVSVATGSVWAFSGAVAIILVWALSGPIFHFSETWQLVINTGTTIITFLMVFVIQHAQNKDMRAIQLKLNELIAAMEGASNRLIDVEDLGDPELETLYRRFCKLARTAETLGEGAKTSIDASAEPKHRPEVKAEASGRKQQRE
jgi:low affinity Fe/Cu permease